ncbi:MAG: hypothetical protein QOD77_301 [Thermoplasmata archaeon]|jgi:hypothetical protein|nr:hypothetical protein [Thermoplasmata archaeon]
MYACPHCNAINMFMAYQDGSLIRVLEDHEDTEMLGEVSELLCIECNNWFPNPQLDAHQRVLTGELVTITGLKGNGTIKTVATGVTFPFHYDTYEEEAARVLSGQPQKFIQDLFEFTHHSDNTLGLRVKEPGNPNTWVYRLDKKRLKKALHHR